jgi:hypothetical protein
MKRHAGAAVVGILVLSNSSSRADTPDLPFRALGDEASAATRERTLHPEGCGSLGPCSAVEPGYFNGLGSPGRVWEIRVDSSFSAGNGTAPARYSLGRFFELSELAGLVARVDFTSTFDTASSGMYSLQGPVASLGVHLRSENADTTAEFGLRLVPPSVNPNARDPSALNLALDSTLTSGQADDALWLNFASLGYQVYLAMQSRARFSVEKGCPGCWMVGARYGGQTSLSPLEVKTWLGPQAGVVGNAYVDFFFGARSFAKHDINLELGLHTEASLSSVWPGSAALPVAAEGFVAWSPKTWIVLRAFTGYATAATQGFVPSRPFGLRLTFYTDSSGGAPSGGPAPVVAYSPPSQPLE